MNGEQPQRRYSFAEVREILAEVLNVSTWWLTLALVLAALSCVDVEYRGGAWTLTFQVTAVTAAIVASIWIPSLVSLVALAGGKATTPAGELATGGLLAALDALPPSAQREAIPPLVAALDTPAGRAITSGDPNAKLARDHLEQSLSEHRVDSRDAIEELAQLSAAYEELRASMPPGRDRTYHMTVVLTRARAIGRQGDLETQDIDRLLDGSEGDRVVGIAVAQGRPSQANPDRLIEIVLHSRSAFEQYAALEALQAASPYLRAQSRNSVAAALRRELDRIGTYLQPGTDRYALARGVLASFSN